MKARVLAILDGTDPHVGRRVAFLINALIILSALAVALETVPELKGRFAGAFLGFELFVVAVFAGEYGLRLWASPRPARYAFSFAGLVDLLSFLPTLLFLGTDWQVVRILRLFRLFRLLKLVRFAAASDRLMQAFLRVRDELAIFSALAALTLYLAAVGIYHFEHRAQPEAFGSIPESLWWAVATLTTVGYGDVVPVTAGGRVFTALVLVVGVGIVALPIGLIGSALAEGRAEAARERESEADRSGPQGP